MIHIHHRQGEGLALAAGQAPGAIECLLEAAPIAQTRERILTGKLGELAVGQLQRLRALQHQQLQITVAILEKPLLAPTERHLPAQQQQRDTEQQAHEHRQTQLLGEQLLRHQAIDGRSIDLEDRPRLQPGERGHQQVVPIEIQAVHLAVGRSCRQHPGVARGQARPWRNRGTCPHQQAAIESHHIERLGQQTAAAQALGGHQPAQQIAQHQIVTHGASPASPLRIGRHHTDQPVSGRRVVLGTGPAGLAAGIHRRCGELHPRRGPVIELRRGMAHEIRPGRPEDHLTATEGQHPGVLHHHLGGPSPYTVVIA